LSTVDHYRTLGLKLEATQQDIKKTYRKLAMQHHPDRNGGNPESEEHLKEINEAYRILGDEDKRRRYDIQYQRPFENYMFYEGQADDDLVRVFRKFSQMGFSMKRAGGCGRKGFGRGGCGRWKR